VRHLEEQVASLEAELAALKHSHGTGTSKTDVDDFINQISSGVAAAIVAPPRTGDRDEKLLSLCSRFYLCDSPVPSLKIHRDDDITNSDTALDSARPVTISSIPSHVVDAMLKHYCKTYRPQYPCIEEDDLYNAKARVAENPNAMGYDVFVVCITLAISCNTLTHVDKKRAAATTYGLWASATLQLEHVDATRSWERLQALQLLTHYGFLNPHHVHVGHCAAAASRLAIQYGLHQELPFVDQLNLDSALLNSRRRLFWNAWGLDA
jgi:hypothetical protein